MKLLSISLTGFLTLNVITVAFTASVRNYAASDFEAVNGEERISQADKRSTECAGCSSMDHNAGVTAEKRTMECTGCASMEDNVEMQPVQKLSPNPINPYLSLKPFLPVKPTFVPPFVDPNYFINKKADLLNNLFGTTNMESSDLKPAEVKRDSVGESINSVQPRLAPFSPFLSSPTMKPTIVPPEYWMPMSGPGIVNPATMIDKKTMFLNTLFNKIAASDSSSVTARAVTPEDLTSAASTAEQPAVPADFWLQFLPSLATPEPPTVKPSIVPPGFWIPSSVSKTSAKPFIPTVPIVDPSEFIDKKTAFLNTLLKTLNITTTPSTETTTESTLEPIPTYLQNVVSPTVKPTIVPPGYWMPMSGPGIVDPATMIDKKTKFLNTLFSKIGAPGSSSVTARAVTPEDLTSAASTAKQPAVPADFWLQFLPSLATPEPPTVKPSIVPPGFWIPSSVSKTSAKPFSPTVPIVDPSEFIDKKTAFLNTLLKTLNITTTPSTETTTESTLEPIPTYLQNVVSPTVKPTIVPPGYWMPMSGPGIVDPATMIDKKTKFLNTLFSKIGAPGSSSVTARAVTPEDLTSSASTAEQSAVPPDFWLQFMPSFTTPESPTVKPSIVPPEFWIPSSVSKTSAKPFIPTVPIVDPSEFIDKKTAFLNTLFKTLNITITPTTETTAESTLDPIPTYLQNVVSPTVKPTIVPPGYWMPMSGPGIVDPATMIDKKTKFLNTLFSKIGAPGSSSVTARAVTPEDLTSAASAAKQSAVPTDFWLQFLPSFATPEPPTVKPTIVPPEFWIPSYVSKVPTKPFSPKIPSVDPSEFISKKNAFLNTLFKTLNITITPSPPKPTADPIAELLYQLLSSAVNNNTQQSALKRSMTENGDSGKIDNINTSSEEQEIVNDIPKVTRQLASLFNRRSTIAEDISVQSPVTVDALLDAKDRLIETIMGELSDIKNNILNTITELLAQQKEAAATETKKKPGPPFGPWGAALLKTTPKSTPDPVPFQNKVEFLSQMFDAVTKLEKDVTDALNEAIKENFSQSSASPTVTSVTSMDQVTNATALLQLIKTKLSELANDDIDMEVPKFSRATFPKGFSTGLLTPKPTIVEPSFWIPKATPGTAVDPTFYLSKTQDFLSKLFASKAAGTPADNSATAPYDKVRSIKMTVHQGYQSLPPGTEELLQAGGGSNSMDHEGGGLKLQDDVFPLPVMPNRDGHHHHHK